MARGKQRIKVRSDDRNASWTAGPERSGTTAFACRIASEGGAPLRFAPQSMAHLFVRRTLSPTLGVSRIPCYSVPGARNPELY